MNKFSITALLSPERLRRIMLKAMVYISALD